MDDCEWMYTGWFGKCDWTDEFVQKVEDFLKKAFEQGQSKAPCPCRQCANTIAPMGLWQTIPDGYVMVKPIVRETRS